MKETFQHIGLAKICAWFGISRQAFYQHSWKAIERGFKEELLLQEVRLIRSNHPRMGTRKLYEKLQFFMKANHIKKGRDALFDLLCANNLLIRKRKRRTKTTNSFHWLRKYSNLIKDFVPSAPNQLWVSDITYWKIDNGKHLYISFITDAYSHKIVGYHVAETLETIESLKALKLAITELDQEDNFQLIHHSDRGIQYCSKKYVKLLQSNNIQISMTENGDPLENAIAERINGIIKGEYLEAYQVNNIKEARRLLTTVVQLYNADRPHLSISKLVPNEVHYSQKPIKVERVWKNYYSNKAPL